MTGQLHAQVATFGICSQSQSIAATGASYPETVARASKRMIYIVRVKSYGACDYGGLWLH